MGRILKRWYIYIILFLIYVPLVVIILLSFNGQTTRGNIELNFGVPTVVNYIELFKNDEFINALLNSVILSVCVVPVTVMIAIITCFGL
jgi:spermidine/putrescine transport system permease protein